MFRIFVRCNKRVKLFNMKSHSSKMQYSEIVENMNNISELSSTVPEKSPYMKMLRLSYIQNNTPNSRDLMVVHHSVCTIIYNTDRKKMVFVRQFRPAVYLREIPEAERGEIDLKKYPVSLGFTLELCAGIVDKSKPLEVIAKEEILEECGYDVPVENITKIISNCVHSVRPTTRQTIYYTEVNDRMRVASGGGVSSEMIEVVELAIEEVKQYISSPTVNSGAGLLLACYWFLNNKPQHCNHSNL